MVWRWYLGRGITFHVWPLQMALGGCVETYNGFAGLWIYLGPLMLHYSRKK